MMSMRKLNQRILAYFALLMALCAFMSSAQAGELRSIGGGYYLQVFWHNDPFKDAVNALDVYAFHETVPGGIVSPATSPALDRTAGDTVKLHAVGLRLESESYHADILSVFGVPEPFTQGLADDIVYTSQTFTPTHAGAYGFIVTGEVQRVGFNPRYFLQKFVCGAGSQDVTYGTFINCVTAP